MYDYADAAEVHLNVFALIVYDRNAHNNDENAIRKFVARFGSERVLGLDGWGAVDGALKAERITCVYRICW